MHPAAPSRRRAVLTIAALVLISCTLAAIPLVQPAAAQPTQPGIQIERQSPGDFSVVSSGRFALRFDANGISAWYDLRRDPQRQRNLVAAASTLLDHRLPGNTRISAAPQLLRATPLRAVIRASGPGWQLDYTVWVGGQLSITTTSPRGIVTTLAADPSSITGAALQGEQSALAPDGNLTQTLTLFLDAWTGDGVPQNGLPSGISAATSAAGTVAVPQTVSRQPRFTVSSWNGGSLSVSRAGHPLVSGVDYLSDYDPATRELTVQYLGLIAPDTDPAARTFQVSPAADPAIRLSIQGRTDVNEQGELVVDGNMPSNNGVETTGDIFYIPYIQRDASVTLVATVDNRPAGSGVRFLVDGYAVATIYGGALQVSVTGLAYGEHRAQVVLIDGSGQPVQIGGQPVQAAINPLGRGVILQSLGDSITAGKYGGTITGGSVPRSNGLPADQVSADGRNFPQFDDYWMPDTAPGTPTYTYYKGYQVELNTALGQCQGGTPRLPIFVLNDGFSGLNAGKRTGNPNRQANRKIAAYKDHIQKLGVEHTLLMLGTNDAIIPNTTAEWEDGSADGSFPKTGIDPLIDQLQGQSADLKVWLATIPWRSDSDVYNTRDQGYNARIPTIIAEQGSQIGAGPDMYALFNGRNDLIPPADSDPDNTLDGLHPNAAGLTAMANAWKGVLCPALPSVTQPTATPTLTATPQFTVTPGPSPTPTATLRPVFAPLVRR